MTNEDFDSRLSGLEKRLDDQKQFLGLIVGIAALLVSILSLVFAWNLSGERESLRFFKAELKEEVRIELKKVSKNPKLEILTMDGKKVTARTLKAKFEHYKGYKSIYTPIVFKNIGESSSGDISLKIYTKKIVLSNLSTDEKSYIYEAMYFPGKSGIDILPGGGFSSVYNLRLYPKDEFLMNPGKYSILVKLYYGEGEVEIAEFELELDKI